MTYYKKLYKFNSYRWCDDQLVYDEENLIHALNNPYFQKIKDMAYVFFTVFANVSEVNGHYNPNTGRHTYTIQAQSMRSVTPQEMAKLYDEAHEWYTFENDKAKAYYYQVSQHNLHYGEPDELSDSDFDQQLAQTFGEGYSPYPFEQEKRYGFGNTVSVVNTWDNYHNYRDTHARFPKSHSSRSNWGHGRVSHTKSANARTNRDRKQSLKLLQHDPDFINTKIRHVNRRYVKNHPVEFPVFDDAEYIEGPFSTGWKHSSKAPHSYLQHTKQKHYHHRDFNQKRQLAKDLNDWTDANYLDPDYYTPEWWKGQPDPNLVSMHDWKANNYDNFCTGYYPTRIGLMPNSIYQLKRLKEGL